MARTTAQEATVANLKPFQPGQSGNPAGKPKGSLNRSTLARKWLEAAGENGLIADDVTLAMIKKAKGGDVAAYIALMDGGYGKLVEKSEVAVTAVADNREDVVKRLASRVK